MLQDQLKLTKILRAPTETNINERAKYTARIGNAKVNTANSNLDGTGTIVTLLSAVGATYQGTQIKSISIQAITDTSEGMIRFFTYDGVNYYLIDEIRVPATKKSGTQPAWEIAYDVEYSINNGDSLAVSTEVADTFIITAEALDWLYPY
jgi:hypothetical protein